jgi:hypothetical protein
MRVTKKRQLCPLCGRVAVVPLTKAVLKVQPDERTHVCHPALGGCNHGFESRTLIRNAETGETLIDLPSDVLPCE